MKSLREGYTTGSCAAAASLASVIWQTTGICPEQVELETPSGVKLYLEIHQISKYICGVIKDSGDDPDVTNGCMVISKVDILEKNDLIRFKAGNGVGTVTRKGLKIPVGEPAINPIPLQMIEKAVRSIIKERGAIITISIPNGEELAIKTFNGRLGVKGGLSILGTTGIVRPMSEEAIKESLRLELSMCYEEYGESCAFVTGYSGENYLKEQYVNCKSIVLCSNYLGYLLDCAEDMKFKNILIVGRAGKLIKPAANIMYLHSHTAGGQREIVCTHSALLGLSKEKIKKLYDCNTTSQMHELLVEYNISDKVWKSIIESACSNCISRTHNKIKIGMLLVDENNQILSKSNSVDEVIEEWLKCKKN